MLSYSAVASKSAINDFAQDTKVLPMLEKKNTSTKFNKLFVYNPWKNIL